MYRRPLGETIDPSGEDNASHGTNQLQFAGAVTWDHAFAERCFAYAENIEVLAIIYCSSGTLVSAEGYAGFVFLSVCVDKNSVRRIFSIKNDSEISDLLLDSISSFISKTDAIGIDDIIFFGTQSSRLLWDKYRFSQSPDGVRLCHDCTVYVLYGSRATIHHFGSPLKPNESS